MSNTNACSPNKENFAFEAVRHNGEAILHSKRAKWYSPCKSLHTLIKSPESNLASLRLAHFAKTPRISFGQVKVGSSVTERLLIQNPHEVPQTLVVEKLSSDKGFYIEANELENDDQRQHMNLGPNKEIVISITWKPNSIS